MHKGESLPDRSASSPPSQPGSCGYEKFFLTARDFFSDICQVGSWESTCLLYPATSTVGKEDGRLNRPADYLSLFRAALVSFAGVGKSLGDACFLHLQSGLWLVCQMTQRRNRYTSGAAYLQCCNTFAPVHVRFLTSLAVARAEGLSITEHRASCISGYLYFTLRTA